MVGGYSFWFKGTAEVPKTAPLEVQPPAVEMQPPTVEVQPPTVQIIEKKEIPWWMWLLVIVLAGGLGLTLLRGD